MTRLYGWKPDLPDKRDQYLQLDHVDASKLPERVDLRPNMPPIWDQGALGACTAFALGRAVAYERYLQGHAFKPSFLHTYYCERAIENTVAVDAGAYIRDGAKVLAQCGVAPDHLWPYVESKFAQKPPKRALIAGLDTRVTSYKRVPRTMNAIKAVFAAGDTIVFGISVYESFESDKVARTGVVPMPGAHEQLLGGHAICGAGYDPHGVIPANSWGMSWGDNGYFYLPWEYVLDPDLSDDFWVLKSVTQPEAAEGQS